MSKFTRTEIEAIHADIVRSLAEIAKKYDMQISAGGITYTEHEMHLKVTAKHKVIDGVPTEEAEFAMKCSRYGLKPEDYKRQVEYQGRTFALVGLNVNAPKFPLIVVDVHTLKQYRMHEAQLALWGGQTRKQKLFGGDCFGS